MYAWATPEKLLDEMSLEQIILYYRYGWEARKTNAQVYWGVLGQALQGTEAGAGEKVHGLEKFKEAHPDAKIVNGAWKVSR